MQKLCKEKKSKKSLYLFVSLLASAALVFDASLSVAKRGKTTSSSRKGLRSASSKKSTSSSNKKSTSSSKKGLRSASSKKSTSSSRKGLRSASSQSATSTRSSKRSSTTSSRGNARRASAVKSSTSLANSVSNESSSTTKTSTSGKVCPVGRVIAFKIDEDQYYYAKKKTCSIPDNAEETPWDSSSSLKKASWIDAGEAVVFQCEDGYIEKKNACVDGYEICPLNEPLEKGGKSSYLNPNTDDECSVPTNATPRKASQEIMEDYGLDSDSAYILGCKEGYYSAQLKGMSDNYIAQCNKCPDGTTSPYGSTSESACVSDGVVSTSESESTGISSVPVYTSGQPKVQTPPAPARAVVSVQTPTPTPTVTCQPGTYKANSTTCKPCPAGKYSSSINATSCSTCAAGKYSAAGATSCSVCEAGKYSGVGASSCYSCSSGYYSSAGSSSCSACPTGQWAVAGSKSCTSCLTTGVAKCDSKTGKVLSCQTGYNLLNGACSKPAVTAASCVAGQYFNGTSCVSCEAGKYSGAGASSCSTCAAGKYSVAGASTCSVCEAGKYSAAGASSCSVCEAGKYSAAGASSCSICEAGTVSVEGSSSCKACSAGTYAVAGSSSCQACSAGTYSVAGSSSCQACSTGTWSSSNAGSCSNCTNKPANSYYTSNGKANDCSWSCNSGYKKDGNNCTLKLYAYKVAVDGASFIRGTYRGTTNYEALGEFDFGVEKKVPSGSGILLSTVNTSSWKFSWETPNQSAASDTNASLKFNHSKVLGTSYSTQTYANSNCYCEWGLCVFHSKTCTYTRKK